MAEQSKVVDNVLIGVALVAIVAAIAFMIPWGGESESGKGGSKSVPAGSSPTTPANPGPVSEDVAQLRSHFEELAARPEKKADYVQVQHILIGFKNDDGQASVPGKPITRSKDEAERLAGELFRRANAGEDFGALVREYTNDSPPGIYGMWQDATNVKPGDYHRGGMVPAFGNVGWKLDVGEIGVSEYSPSGSPYGYHIIKRLK